MTRNASQDDAAAQEAPPEEEHIGTFYAFRYPNFRLLWLGDLFTAAAWWMQTTATVWVVYTITGSGQAVGGINAIRIVPTLLLTSIAGVISDRYSRNRIIAISQIGLVLCTFLVAFLLATGSIQVWHLFVFTVIVGVAQTFNMPARQAFVFELVPRRIIPNAVALSWFAFSTSRAVGPAIGGVFIVFLGAANNYFLQSLAYFGVLVSILLIRAPARPEVTSRPTFWQSLRDGYGFVLTNPEARVMVIMSIISPLLIIPVHMALFPIFAEDTFHTGAAGLGILAGSVGFGGLFGGLLVASLSHIDRRGLLQLGALFVFSLAETTFALLALFTGNMLLAAPFLVLAGIAEPFYTTTNTAVLQLLAPERMRGSMAAVLQLSFLFVPLGAIISGTAADYFGAPAVAAVTTFMAFCIGLAILILSPEMRNMRLSVITQNQAQ